MIFKTRAIYTYSVYTPCLIIKTACIIIKKKCAYPFRVVDKRADATGIMHFVHHNPYRVVAIVPYIPSLQESFVLNSALIIIITRRVQSRLANEKPYTAITASPD